MKTNRIIIFVFILIPIIFLASCEDFFEDRIEGNNKVVTKERTINSFDEISIAGDFDVYLKIADSTSLQIQAEENIVPFIITKVSGLKLHIEPKDNYMLNNHKPMKLFLTTPTIEGVTLTGAGALYCDSLSTDFLGIEVTGSGKVEFNKINVTDVEADISGSGIIYLTGDAQRGDFQVTGSGSIRSLDLIQNECEAKITGSGNMYINVIEYLRAKITGSGNIYYRGTPDIDRNITGSGNVKRY